MKSQKTIETHGDYPINDVISLESAQQANTAIELELILTNSSFGYEYAMIALKEQGELGLVAEHIKSQLDACREVYLEARQKLQILDAVRLSELEQGLQRQKNEIFTKSESLH